VSSFNDTNKQSHSFGPSTIFLSLKIRNLSVDISNEVVTNPLQNLNNAPTQANVFAALEETSEDTTEYFDSFKQESKPPSVSSSRPSLTSRLSMRNLNVKDIEAPPSPSPTIQDVTIIFPLPSKDPLIEYRKMYDIVQAFSSGSRDGILKYENNTNYMSCSNLASLRSFQKRNTKLKDSLLKSKTVVPWEYCRTSDVEVY
jgi:hypothetical protein